MMSRTPMLRSILPLIGLALACGTAGAGPAVGTVLGTPASTTTTVQARVVSATPVVAQVASPRQVCYDTQQPVQEEGSGAGALMGAIAGSAMGNAVGKGAGNALATGIGIIGGAILGDKVETQGRTAVQTVRRCEQQTAYDNRVVAYDVVYEYNGQQFSTQMAQEPGPTLPLQITLSPGGVAPMSPPSMSMNGGAVTFIEAPPPPVRYAPPVVVYPAPWGWGPPRHHGGPYHRW